MSEIELVPVASSVMDPEALSAFVDMVERRQQIKKSIKQWEDECKELDSAITQLMTDKAIVKVSHERRTISLVASTRSSLSKVKLLENGVDPDIIELSTDTKTYSYLLVSEEKVKPGQGREED